MAKKKEVKRIKIALAYLPAIEYDNGEFVTFDNFEDFYSAITADKELDSE